MDARKVLRQYSDACAICTDTGCDDCDVIVVIQALENQLQNVRCKECDYWCRKDMELVGVCKLAGWYCGEAGFCLYGKKKEV